MKCLQCRCEMLLDRVVEKVRENKEEYIYKCPNKQCSNYGYRKNRDESNRRE